MPTRATFLQAYLDGTLLPQVLAASCTYSWKQNVPTATVYVPTNPLPGSPAYNLALDLRMGAGTNNIQRFIGLFRGYSYAMWPRALGLRFKGFLTLAAEYQNHADPLKIGGLTLLDLLGAWTGTDADVVRAALNTAGVSFSGGNIGGTGVTWGSRGQISTNGPGLGYANYLWRAGTATAAQLATTGPIYDQGQSALDYIQTWDAASAVYTDDSSPVGFYRTYETPQGIYRALIGGRPRNGVDLTFTEGIDIEQTGQGTRDYPVCNAIFVTGFDSGMGVGPVRNVDANENWLGFGGNPYQPTNPITQTFASPYIEWSNRAEGGVGMDCETVGDALLADLNRETVTARFRTPRDDLIADGMTILVQGPGGQPDRLGIGEPLWVDSVTSGVDPSGFFYQDIQATGGGLPDSSTPAPPF